MDHFQYLMVMMCCLVVTAPLEFLGARVYRRPKRLARAVIPVAALFLVWDAIAIAAGVWTFNPRYVTGARLPFSIPVEELVFFLVIPACALLTYGCVESLLPRPRGRATGKSARPGRRPAVAAVPPVRQPPQASR